MIRRALFHPRATEAERVRSFVTDALTRWRLLQRVPDDEARLVATELFSNAIRHARHDGERLPVVVRWDDEVLRIEVHDPDPRQPVPSWRSTEEDSGRGLLLVEALSYRWGTLPIHDGGKCVYAELAPLKPDE